MTPANKNAVKRIVVLSNVYDDQYHLLRSDVIARCLSSPKRRGLFRCLEMATGREVTILSSPPRGAGPRHFRWLPELETRFSIHRQFFCSQWDMPKANIPLSWFLYTRHVLGHARDGDILLIDNYELIYVLAALFTRIFRKVTVVLDYEDGKHLIDQGWQRFLSGLAEFVGRPLLRGALLAHPGLAARLPASLPTELVPGFVVPVGRSSSLAPSEPIRFVYSGSLDRVRGVDLLLQALDFLPESGWHLDVTGFGTYTPELTRLASSEKYRDRVTFHGSLDQAEYDLLISQSHVGLNCQRPGNPVSDVTFPSKIFSYLSSGLRVLSSRAGGVPQICGSALLYVEEETPESLAAAMKAIIESPDEEFKKADDQEARRYFSLEQTALRLREFFQKITT